MTALAGGLWPHQVDRMDSLAWKASADMAEEHGMESLAERFRRTAAALDGLGWGLRLTPRAEAWVKCYANQYASVVILCWGSLYTRAPHTGTMWVGEYDGRASRVWPGRAGTGKAGDVVIWDDGEGKVTVWIPPELVGPLTEGGVR